MPMVKSFSHYYLIQLPIGKKIQSSYSLVNISKYLVTPTGWYVVFLDNQNSTEISKICHCTTSTLANSKQMILHNKSYTSKHINTSQMLTRKYHYRSKRSELANSSTFRCVSLHTHKFRSFCGKFWAFCKILSHQISGV